MNLFNTKTFGPENLRIVLEDEQDFYSTGDHVHGSVLVSHRNWKSMHVEVFLVCEEHAELDPEQTEEADFDNRRIYIAGESVDGFDAEDEDEEVSYGQFPFELRVIDDPRSPYLLPSFEAESGELVNAVRWFVETRISYKDRAYTDNCSIVVIPAHATPCSEQQRIIRNEISMKVQDYKRLRSEGDSNISGILQIPDHAIRQGPACIPMKMLVLVSRPNLVIIREVKVKLIAEATVRLNGQVSKFTAAEELASAQLPSPNNNSSEEIIDLTNLISNCTIEGACPSFAGKWLEVTHQIQVTVNFAPCMKPKARQSLNIYSDVQVLSPRLSADYDSPPRYTPSIGSSLEASPRVSPGTSTISSTVSLSSYEKSGLGVAG